MDMATQFFEVKVTETKTFSDGKVDTRLVDKIQSRCPDVTCRFLVRHGVEANAVAEADMTMQHRDHNCAHFGMNGSFVFSEYEGPVH
jgi:hypothetical protein